MAEPQPCEVQRARPRPPVRALPFVLFDRPERPTALIGFNDKAAVGALAAAAERGLRVPADLSVAGFDDIDLAQATSPQLTTVRQPLLEMGRMVLERDLGRLECLAIHVAPCPRLARLRRSHQWMPGRLEVGVGVPTP